MRERHTAQTINSYLDTPAGKAQAALHGSRQGAAAAMAEAENADRAWRRSQALIQAERYPGRYPSVDDAMLDIPDPAQRGPSSWFDGTTDEWVAAMRWVDPACGARNLGGEPEDGAVTGYTQGPGRDVELADTRPPWQRER